jgi:hypothetical protein
MTIKLTPSTMTDNGRKLVEASRMLWQLYQIMEYCYYQAVDIVRENPNDPDWQAVATLFGLDAPEKAAMLFEILSNAQAQARAETINDKPNALIAVMWKIAH